MCDVCLMTPEKAFKVILFLFKKNLGKGFQVPLFFSLSFFSHLNFGAFFQDLHLTGVYSLENY